MKKRILFVCLGNICRSPAAEGVFLNLLSSKQLTEYYDVDSAGTGGWHVGSQADSRMRYAAQKRGINILSISRQIKQEDLYDYDLILAMDNDNLKEIKNLAKGLNIKLDEKIKLILSYSPDTSLLEVPDPYYGGEKGFEKVLDLLEDACNGLLEDITLKH